MTEGHEHAFTRVDTQSDPRAWIGVLDRVGAEPQYRAYKRRMLELLGPQAGGRYLDVGAGTGAGALECAARYEVDVVGVDASRVMVGEARGRGLPEVVVAGVHALPSATASFDGVWSDRTFQHLAHPVAGLEELVRVVHPGGTVIIADPDYDTQVVDIPDQELARRILRSRRDGLRNGALAHQMGRLFADAGLVELRVEAIPIVLREPHALDNALGLRDWAESAHEASLIDADEVETWRSMLDEAAVRGHFLYSFVVFITTGRVRQSR